MEVFLEPDSMIPILAALSFALLGVIALWLWARRGRVGGVDVRVDRGTIQMLCSVCRREMVFGENELVVLSAVEMALVVRNCREAVGHKLAEHVCPYCEAAHCFIVDGGRPSWIGVNFYTPQVTSNRCAECKRPLRTPPWTKGYYDGRLNEVPELAGDYGLVCRRCGAVCCVDCCQRNTRKPGPDGAFLCPRCAREGMSAFYHSG